MENIDSGSMNNTIPPEHETEDEPRSLRQKIQAARQAMDLKQKAKDKLEEKITAPARAGTSKALCWAWMTLPTLINFVPSLIYINMHVFLKAVFGEKLFCKLGEEWIPKQVAGTKAGKAINKSAGLIEGMCLMFLDAILLIAIVALVSLIVDKDSLEALSK